MACGERGEEDEFGGDCPHRDQRSGSKRPLVDLEGEEEEEEVVFGTKKRKMVEESGPGAATGMILSLRENLQNCKDKLVTCQSELEEARTEIRKWYSAFQNAPGVPTGTNPDPGLTLIYLQNLKSSEESLKEKLEKAKKREGAIMVAYAKREQQIADLKIAIRDLKKQLRPPSIQTRQLLLDPAVHKEFTRLQNLVEEKDKKVKELEDNVAAINFSANSRLGKLLMAKCRTLQEENEEIGTIASEGKIHELEMKIAVLNSENTELRSQFGTLYKHMEGLTSDMDRSNELVYVLEEKLEAKDYEIVKLKKELMKANEMLIELQAVKGKTTNDDKEMLVHTEEEDELVVDVEAVDDHEIVRQKKAIHDDLSYPSDQEDEMDATKVDIET